MTKFKLPLLILFLFFIISAALTLHLASMPIDSSIDVVNINRIQKEIETHWDDLKNGDYASYGYDFSVVDLEGNLLYQTHASQDHSLSYAFKNRLPVVDIVISDQIVGKALIVSDLQKDIQAFQSRLVWMVLVILTLFCSLGIFYILFLNRYVLKPFGDLQAFAKQVASGNLDLPLTMDRQNIFGAFTESFDLMRNELALSRQKEYEANQSKKELVASLSHDIKTPVTGIKLISELLMVTHQEESLNSKLSTIYDKAEQINLLISDMFHSTLEDLGELQVTPTENYSSIFESIVKEADYYNKVTLSPLPACMLFVDPLRLSQVINNIIYNAYKYGGPSIHITPTLTSSYLEVSIHDNGNGVSEEDLPLLFNKFYRGHNTKEQTGTGLGLYIAKQLMNQMEGDLSGFNTSDGFTVLLLIKLV